MGNQMFCFQCEQTAGCKACTGKMGVCGKSQDVANEQDELTGAMIALAATCKAAGTVGASTYGLMVDGLFTTVTNVNFNLERVARIVADVRAEKAAVASVAGIEAVSDYAMERVWGADEDIRSLKSLVLFGIRGVAAYAYHARVLGRRDEMVDAFFVEALAALADEGSVDALLPLVLKVGEVNLACMALLDGANVEAFGSPVPPRSPSRSSPARSSSFPATTSTTSSACSSRRRDAGSTSTHMARCSPAHAYPELKRFAHLKGNFGTAWQNQKKEFDGIPGAVLFTTNCLVPPKGSYANRVFTTEMVSYPELVHIPADAEGKKDFSPVIEKAIELGGYGETQHFTGINGGSTVMCGFARDAVLGVADIVIQAVKDGTIRHFFLVGGCDGAKPGRNYYTEFVKATPADTVVLTLACGKYRFNDLDLGTIGGLPRIMDVGQCNDAYSAIQIAVALAGAFECGVNDLPLSFVLSWYEQKAVCVLLTLLSLGITNIKLGPSLPAFVSPNVLNILVEKFGIAPISTPEADLAEFLGE